METIIFIESSKTGAGAMAIDMANRKGYHTILMTRDRNIYTDDVTKSALQIIDCETNDLDILIKEVCKIKSKFDIKAIITMADMYVPQCAYVASYFGLAGLDYQSARNARNKYNMRRILDKNASNINIRYFLADNIDIALKQSQSLGFPLVAKLQEENNSFAVKLIKDTEELVEYFRTYSKRDYNNSQQKTPRGILLEEFLPWDEYSIETIQGVNGKRYVMGVTKKHLVDFSQGHFVEQGHYFPYVGPENKLLIEATNKALDELGINFGAAHTECKIRGKEVKIVEVNPRLAGNKIGSHLISKSTGVCVVEKILDGALGKSIIWAPCLNKGAAIFCLCADKNGTLTEIQLPLTHHPDAFFAHSKSVGACVRVPQDNDDRIAEVIAISETGESAYRRAKTLASEIRLSIAATEEA